MDKHFDTIIIGSGLGGLLCANILSMEGQKVLVLEKNNQLGGNLQIFKRDGVLFDTGVHYIGGLAEGENLNQLFKYHGILDQLHLEPLDQTGFEEIRFKGDSTPYYWAQGYDKFKESLCKQFPQEEEAIEKYIAKIQWACEQFPLYNLRQEELNPEGDLLTLNAFEFIDSLTQNEKLKGVLAGNSFLFAGDPKKTPFYVLALVCNSYIKSAHKIKGGGGQIAQALAKKIRSRGGEIKRYQEVCKIEVENGAVQAVLTKQGDRFTANNVISNAHPLATYGWVTEGIRPITLNRIKRTPNSVSAFSTHLVLKPNSVINLSKNIYYFQQLDVWNNANYTSENWPKGIMISTPSERKSSEFAKGISLLAYMHTSDFAEFENTFNTIAEPNQRGQAYENLKTEKAKKMIAQLLEVMPEVEGNIEAVYTSSPLSYRDYIGSPNGSMYGIQNDCNQPLATMLNPSTRIKGLYLTGQNLNLHGILGVSMSALKTCGELLVYEGLVEKVKG